MATTQNDPNKGASFDRAEELKQANIEGAKFKATMEGLNAVFKDLKTSSGSALKQDTELLGQLSSLGKGYAKAIKLADGLKGINLTDLKTAKQRTEFQKKLQQAQGDQSRVVADIAMLEDTVVDKKAEQAIITSKVEKLNKLVEATDLRRENANRNLNIQKEAEVELYNAIEKKQEEANKLSGDAKVLADKEIANMFVSLEQRSNMVAQAQSSFDLQNQRVDKLNAELLLNEDLEKTLERQIEASDAALSNAKEYLETIDQTIVAADGVSKAIDDIANATPKFIAAFEDFAKMTSGIPIVGEVINQITGDIGKSAKMFKDAKAAGVSTFKAWGTAAGGFIKLGAFAAISAFISKVIEGAKIGSDAMKTLNKSVAGTSMNMSAQMGRIGAAAGKFTVPLNEAAATIAGINDSLGMSLDFTSETTEQAIKLANKYGVSVDAVAHIVKNSAANKKTMTETVDAVTAGVARFNEMNNVSISTKAIFEDIGKASATTLRGIGKQPGALAAAAAAARSLGMSMEDIRAASESTTDFQKSLTDEMTTEMMLGKQLNLNKLREAALTGDVKGQAEEMKRLVMENQGRIGNNVKLQEQFAATLGISRDQYNDMLKTQDAMSVLTGKSGAAQEENDKNRKKSNAEIAESVERSVSKLTSLADTLAKMQEGIATGAKGFFDDLVDGFKGDTLYEKVKSGLGNAFTIAWEGFKQGITDIFNGDFSGTSLGRLLGSLAVLGGGAALVVKGAGFIKGLKNLFKGERGSFSNPTYIKNVDGMGGLDASDLTNKLGKAGFFKQVKTLFKKPSVFFRALKMKGGFLGKMIGRFGTMFTKIKLPNLTRIFSKIKLPNLTKIFSKIKLPKFPSIKIPKIPKIPNVGKGLTSMLSKVKIPPGAASGLMKTIGGKVLAPLELAMGAFTGATEAAGKTAEEKKAAGIREDMGAVEGGIQGLLTGDAKKGSVLSSYVGVEKGSAGDEALGIASAAGRGALTGAALTAWLGPGAAIGAAVGGVIGGAAESFKVFSDPNSKLRKGISEFASNTWSKAKEIGNKVKEGAIMVGAKIKDFAVGVKDKALEVAGRMKEFAGNVKDKAFKVADNIANFAVGVKDKAFAFATSVGEGISNFATSAKDKAVELATAVGEGISNFATSAKEKISGFASTVGAGIMSFASTARDKAQQLAGAIGDKVGAIRDRVGDFIEANDGILGGMRAAAAGLASQAKKWLGKAWKATKNFITGDKTKSKSPEIKQKEIKKVTAPLMQMSKDQAKTFTTAINTAIEKSTKGTVKAMDSLGDVLENPLGENAKAANNQLAELRKLKSDGDKQHSKELLELRNQTALLYQYIKNPQANIIKMNTFKVGQSLTRL